MSAPRWILLCALAGCASGGGGRAPAAPLAETGPAESLAPVAPAPQALAALPDPAPMRGEDPSPPRGGALSPNGSVAGRFGAVGQEVAFEMQAQKGELVLIEIAALGFSRGWQATAAVRVLGPGGRALLERERAGGASFALLVPFVAPATGAYALELAAPRETYRYQVVRHAGLSPNRADRRQPVEGARAYGYLADGDDRAFLALELGEGEAARVAVAPAREPFKKAQETARAERLSAALRGRADDAEPPMRPHEPDGIEQASCPTFALERPDSPGAAAAAEILLPGGAARTVRLDVVGAGSAEGGLFELEIERAPALHRVTGRVGDADDDPCAGLAVSFLREPSLSPLAETVTAADGTFEARLPEGDYSILVSRGPESRAERARTRVEGPAEINLIYAD